MEKIIKREQYLSKIRHFYDSDYIKVITGIRRSGKSVILQEIIKEIKKTRSDKKHIIYIDLESKKNESIKTRIQLEEYIESCIKDRKKYYIFIDEIQHIKRFEEAIASIRVSFKCSLFVTGSNSTLLKGKLQDRLTGRAKEFVIYPFTYNEVMEYKKINRIQINDNELEEYIKYGGMPQRFKEIDEDGYNNYLRNIYKSIVEKDVFEQHKRINKSEFNKIAKYIISHSGKLFSALSIAKYVKSSLPKERQRGYADTVNDYARYLEESFFISECPPYYLNGKEMLNGTKKYYCIDPGIRNALGSLLKIDESFSLECVIYNELIVRGYDVKYGKFRNGEIDFVVSKNRKKCLIQVTNYINDEKVFNREYGAFSKIKDNSPKYVLSLNTLGTSYNGITHINIVDFLLGKVDISLM